MNRKRAFTLIELLVVIAVIALLIGILLPALGKARTSGQLTVSSSNLRSLGQLTFSYSNEQRDSVFNPFSPTPPPGFTNVKTWYSVIVPHDNKYTWQFADSTRYSEMFAAHWASLMMHYTASSPGGLLNAVQFSPLDRTVLSRFKDFLATTKNWEDYIWDGSYFYSPTFWTSPERYKNDTLTSYGPSDSKYCKRNKQSDVAYPQAKVMLFERFDFGTPTRASKVGVLKNFPTFCSTSAKPRVMMADNSVRQVRIQDLVELSASKIAETKRQFTPSGLWDVGQGTLNKYDMGKDGLENGNGDSNSYPAWFWATRDGLKGRDINN